VKKHDMTGGIYNKPATFSVVALLVILAGTVATMLYPMLRDDMSGPRLEALRPYTPLELAGRDVYQREGCMGCHTQTVRPLASEVARYGDYSKVGEFAYDRPHLWGSKRTGPDLAREGGVRPDDWHVRHFVDPRALAPRSNMPSYAFLKEASLDPETVRRHYRAFASAYRPGELGAGDEEFAALSGKTEMDALVAYMQWLGHAVPRECAVGDLLAVNPLTGKPEAIARGKLVYENNCVQCHGEEGEGIPEVIPSILDAEFLGQAGDPPDGTYFGLVSCGSDAKKKIGRPGSPEGGMTAFGGQLPDDDIWAVIAFIRERQAHERDERH
jgi:cytochrome c oxidase cbb3-type subunit 2